MNDNDATMKTIIDAGSELGIDRNTIGRIKKILSQYASVDAMLGATKGELMAAYNRARGETNKRGLGAGFFRAIDRIRAHFCVSPTAVVMSQEATGQQSPMKTTVFDFAELKALVSFMELCGIAKIDIRKIAEFCNAIDVKLT